MAFSPDLPSAITLLSSPDNNTYDAFKMKLNPVGTQVLYSRYLGGKATEKATDLAVDGSGNVYVTGTINSTDFPVSRDAFQPQCKDSATMDATAAFDAFVTKLNPSRAMVYSSYLSGSPEEAACWAKVKSRSA